MREGLALGALLIVLGIINLSTYVFATPHRHERPIPYSSLYRKAAPMIYSVAVALAVLRVPYGLMPYACKVALFIAGRGRVRDAWRTSRAIQLARTLGDFANFGLTTVLLGLGVILLGGGWLWSALGVVVTAEMLRLIFEKGQALTSAAWQSLPHRAVAGRLSGDLPEWLQAYRDYYSLSDVDRLAAALNALRAKVSADADLSRRVSYVKAFRIVPDDHPLEAGDVRDVAAGEVYIHRAWTSDPFLLMGLAVRRGAWLFDPRYLRRPFHYRTESNALATLAVWQAAPICPPFALYQLGHEIKAARYGVYFRLCHLIGFNNEKFVLENGVHPYDQIIGWLDRRLGWNTAANLRPLWSDEEVIADAPVGLTAGEIARRYTYPVCYVEEVLMERIRQRQTD